MPDERKYRQYWEGRVVDSKPMANNVGDMGDHMLVSFETNADTWHLRSGSNWTSTFACVWTPSLTLNKVGPMYSCVAKPQGRCPWSARAKRARKFVLSDSVYSWRLS